MGSHPPGPENPLRGTSRQGQGPLREGKTEDQELCLVCSVDWLIDWSVRDFVHYVSQWSIDWLTGGKTIFFHFFLLINQWNQSWIVLFFCFQESKVVQGHSARWWAESARWRRQVRRGLPWPPLPTTTRTMMEEDDEWRGMLFLHSFEGGDFLQVQNDHAALRTVPHTHPGWLVRP